jgi:hypothetical protein
MRLNQPHSTPSTPPSSTQLHPQDSVISLARSPGHYEEWLLACKGGPQPVSTFDYAGPLTEIVLLGVLALRTPGERLQWDSTNLKVTNAPELDAFIKTEYRNGWTL